MGGEITVKVDAGCRQLPRHSCTLLRPSLSKNPLLPSLPFCPVSCTGFGLLGSSDNSFLVKRSDCVRTLSQQRSTDTSHPRPTSSVWKLRTLTFRNAQASVRRPFHFAYQLSPLHLLDVCHVQSPQESFCGGGKMI